MSWEHFPHNADIGIRGVGKTLEQAFTEAAKSLTSVVTSLERVEPIESVTVECSNSNIEFLFFDWINEIIFKMDTLSMLFSEFQVNIHGDKLSAVIVGEKITPEKHKPAVDIKGATLTELKVYSVKNNWIVQCVVDV